MYYYVDNTEGNTGEEPYTNGWKTYNKDGTGNEVNANIINISQAFGVIVNGNKDRNLRIYPSARTLNTSNGFNKKQRMQQFNNYFELDAVGNNYIDKIYFKINNNATTNYDPDFDAYKLYSFGASPVISFLSSDSKKLAICETPEVETVDLGFFMRADGEVTLSLKDINDFESVVLEDKKEGTFTDLTKKTYMFNYSSDDDETGRFTLHFPKNALGEYEQPSNMKIYSYNKILYLKSTETIDNVDVKIFDLKGQIIFNNLFKSVKETEIYTDFPNGIYILEITSDKGKTTQKILLSN
jgi:hypothetical protein